MTDDELEFVLARSKLLSLGDHAATRWEFGRAAARQHAAEQRLRDQGYTDDDLRYFDGVAQGQYVE